MSEKEIIYANNLIAKFLEWKLDGVFYGYYRQFNEFLYNPQTGNNRAFHLEQLSFNESWDWLMLVIDKIESLGNYSCIEKISSSEHRCYFSNTELGGERAETKMEAIYKACLQFINWYNQKDNKDTIEVVSKLVNIKFNLR